MKTICFDLDDTICFPNHDEKDTYYKYGMAKPNNDLIAKMRKLRAKGYSITISTARRMLTHNGDIDAIISDVGEITEQWLEDFNVPYDKLVFGKPYSDTYYVDDKAMNVTDFMNWEC